VVGIDGRMVERMNTAVSRMRVSLRLLGDNAQARLAFALANRAMLDQMKLLLSISMAP